MLRYLCRKISANKWNPNEYTGDEGIRADVLGSCLRTADDEISLWACDFELAENGNLMEADVGQVALILIASSERIDKVELILIAESELSRMEIRIVNTPQHVPDNLKHINHLSERHYDACELTVEKINHLAHYVAKKIRLADSLYITFSKNDLREIVRKAIIDGTIEVNNLAEKVKAEIQKKYPEIIADK